MSAKRRTLDIVTVFGLLNWPKTKILLSTKTTWIHHTSYRAPKSDKLAGIIFVPVINSLISYHNDRYKFADDLSMVLVYLVENTILTKKFSDHLFDRLKTECSCHDLTIDVAKSKIICFNTLKRNRYASSLYPDFERTEHLRSNFH